MPRKARVEGSKSPKPSKEKHDDVVPTAEDVAAFAEPPEAPKKKLANPVPGDDGDALDRIVAYFRDKYPTQWEEVRLCPAEHSLTVMAQTLRGNG